MREQAKSGYSVADQEEALRSWCAENGHELLEVVRDEGHSGAYLERPGLDRVRDLVEAGGVSLVVAQDADRIAREPYHRMLLDDEFERRSCKLLALDDWGGDSHEGQLLKFMRGWVAKGERIEMAERTRRGRRRKTKQGYLVAPSTVPFGFTLNENRNGYVVDEKQMAVVRRIFQLIADGASFHGVKRALETDGVPSPSGGERWSRWTLRDLIGRDAYFPCTYPEVAALVAPGVAERLNPERRYGVTWASRHDWKVLVARDRRPDACYRDRRERGEKPREEWLALPTPDAGIPREVAERARRNVEPRSGPPRKTGWKFWELSGGVLRYAECGRNMLGHTVAPRGRKRYYHYVCPQKIEEACGNRRAERESKPLLRDAREAANARERLAKLEIVEDNYRDQQAEGLITMTKLREMLDGVRAERERLEARLAMLAEGESHLRQLEELPTLAEEWLADLPHLVDRMPVIRGYETVGAEPTDDGSLPIYTLTPERIRYLPEEEVADRRREAERGTRVRELYGMLGLRAEVHADGTLDIIIRATNGKGDMPCDERS